MPSQTFRPLCYCLLNLFFLFRNEEAQFFQKHLFAVFCAQVFPQHAISNQPYECGLATFRFYCEHWIDRCNAYSSFGISLSPSLSICLSLYAFLPFFLESWFFTYTAICIWYCCTLSLEIWVSSHTYAQQSIDHNIKPRDFFLWDRIELCTDKRCKSALGTHFSGKWMINCSTFDKFEHIDFTSISLSLALDDQIKRTKPFQQRSK